ncbi:MAG: undecaprenyldiphospho-muramoylpentapeptide beta-N-acetylglucosaminyltransferase [Ectothiorhodospiraceae bacterium]
MNSAGLERPVLIMAGGTGGHVFPALAVADALRARGVPVVWLGTRDGLEARVVPEAGIALEWLRVRGLRGKGWLGWLVAPARVLRAVFQARAVLRRQRPRCVLGLGGYVAGPGALAAWLQRVPLVIHEQNARPGLTNRVLARLARRVLCGFPGTFPAERAQVTGNPVRGDILRIPPPEERHGAAASPRLLVIGGSQGARALNEVIPRALAQLPPERSFTVWHQSGARTEELAREGYSQAGVAADVVAFISDMAAAYAWADVVVCRAGALTVSELAVAGVPAVLVPLPQAVDDHQTANAGYLVQAGAAELLPQGELTPERLAEVLARLAGDPQQRADMARAARGRARPEAAETVAEICLEVSR